MTKRKFKPGEKVRCIDDLLKHDFFILHGKTYHTGWCRSWTINLAWNYIQRGELYFAERVVPEDEDNARKHQTQKENET